ncbi:putative oligosaccharyltransferase complex subunit epsilon [Paratrimastix pyriformis]|uniref:Dolichyl-diphosphooligosaccharide--protein glycosyltransferase subunit OST2 n=1 Tax=Paratrimastix pyriformis TaxID=342808 RepID=A0ABQ8U6J0_9EUKA|nr:putative oligosaccharyltransferase complex subunit epsilon [Paratrimastix pyriformis]
MAWSRLRSLTASQQAVLPLGLQRIFFVSMSSSPSASPAVQKESLLGGIWANYRKETDARTRLIDLLIVFCLLLTGIQLGYAFLIGSFPFNSVVAGIFSCCGTAVLAANLRVQMKYYSTERSFAEFLFCNLILHFLVFSYIG